jgi:hypothetical protein
VVSVRKWRQRAAGQADAELIRRTAGWLRDDPRRARYVGLTCDEDTRALAALLDLLATELPHLDPGVRSQVVESCRVVLGESMARPTTRRTRGGDGLPH